MFLRSEGDMSDPLRTIRRGGDSFRGLPRGRIQQGATAPHAAERVLREEAGVTSSIEIGPCIGQELHHEHGEDEVVYYYLATSNAPFARSARMAIIQEIQWVDENAIQLNASVSRSRTEVCGTRTRPSCIAQRQVPAGDKSRASTSRQHEYRWW